MTFENLNLTSPLLNAISDLGFTDTTSIQEKAFSVIMSGRDVCGIAQTGTGKTIAYLLPLLRQFKYSKDKIPEVLIIVPTRELVVQVVEEIKKLSAYMTVRIVGVYGGVNMKPQVTAVQNGADFIVATPGRLLDLIYNGYLKTKGIKKLVIDEVDEMLNLGFRKQIDDLLELLPEKKQNLLFSATITEEVELLMNEYFNQPIRIEAAPMGTPLENINQTAYEVPNFNTKVNLLNLLLKSDEDMTKVLVFVGTKKLANDLFERLELQFPEKVGVIHSNKEQKHRFNTVNQFHNGEINILIATDIVARGIDIHEVTHVLNFDTPDVAENYIHRIGRTGRADKKGISITFITESEKEYQTQIEELMKFSIPIIPLPDDLEISTELTEDEIPKVKMKTYLTKLPKRENVGAAFHQKSAKNQKVNFKVKHEDKMMKKYGKKQTRGKKR